MSLASWLKNTGLCDALEREENAEELKDLWHFFKETNKLLLIEVREWKDYYKSYKGPIFKAFETIENPLAVACLLHILQMEEDELFWDKDDLQNALRRECKPFSTAVANLMNEKKIKDITAEDIFSK